MQPTLTNLTTAPPLWLAIAFALTTAVTLWGFVRAVRVGTPRLTTAVFLGLLSWLALLGLLASQDFFTKLDVFPPRLVVAVLPNLLLILALFVTKGGRRFVDALPLSTLTYLNMVRIPVELVLYGLAVHRQIPELMTFDGRNFDILAGLTAPLIAYFTLGRPVLSMRWLLVWHSAALLLLVNIVTLAVLSAPSPFQQLAFDQPNVAVLKFPFIWLPGFIVPIVLLGHLIAIRRLSTTTSRPF
ncbi:hypothetical protein HNV11_18630 [Spirosoma taeanense]|uniref:Uncharacterized protein n=1 Tax=Spirosoma taeanense TaxID=2735870 RepID=A0A6M5YD57_9BACT|nr:hypothetical protein [Spirosoma taeanense]QJW91246.1 hypothetical protein HNV11_18630 [Spirosoma taeanense]